ncbi:hypothetical protein [Nocardioides sp.]|uniref:hypothetical protein n=1 Tax=Nocardioides sp. TaxID=35761 RepID=UPI0025EC7FB1|nr:hypothetical protein [Nocardioides sp.]
MIEYGARAKRLPAPPHVVWDDLVARKRVGVRAWLALRGDEIEPEVLGAARPHLVVWSSLWPARPDDRVEMTLTARGTETLLGFRLLAPGAPPGDDLTQRIRYRVNRLLYDDLRRSYDG